MPAYALYYLLPVLAAYLTQRPVLLAFIAVLVLLREVLPDPGSLIALVRYANKLRWQIEQNPANAIARRDLANIYLDARFNRAAANVLKTACDRFPSDRNLARLRGLALFRIGDNEAALQALGVSVGAFGESSRRLGTRTASASASYETYLLAAQILERLKRPDPCIEALEAACDCNSSALEPRVRLAILHHDRGDKAQAKVALDEARRAWSGLPGFAKRRQWRWYARYLWTRVIAAVFW